MFRRMNLSQPSFQPNSRKTVQTLPSHRHRHAMAPPSYQAFAPLVHTVRANYACKKPECDPTKNYYAEGGVKRIILSNGQSADVGSAAHIWDQTDLMSRLIKRDETVLNTIRPSTMNTEPELTPQPK